MTAVDQVEAQALAALDAFITAHQLLAPRQVHLYGGPRPWLNVWLSNVVEARAWATAFGTTLQAYAYITTDGVLAAALTASRRVPLPGSPVPVEVDFYPTVIQAVQPA